MSAALEDVPLSLDDLAELLASVQPLPSLSRLAVGVSGGADSLCLTLMLHTLASRQGWQLDALTFDHGLRPDSTDEAHQVHRILAQRSIRHTIIPWQGAKPTANIHDAARRARYEQLTAWCRAASIPVLAVAHHQQDVAETFLIRLGRGSGLKGLAAMQPVTRYNDTLIIRPLLPIPSSRLRATLQQVYQQDWLEDPSNSNPRFTRTRMRGLLPLLATHGIPSARIAEAAFSLRRAQNVIDRLVIAHLEHCLDQQTPDRLIIDRARLLSADEEIIFRSLAECLQRLAPQNYPPRFASLQKLVTHLQNPAPCRRTLHHCRILNDGQKIIITRDTPDKL